MATEAAKNIICKDDRISNGNLLALVDGSETALHSHAGGGGTEDVRTDRGDPAAWDWTLVSSPAIVTDGAWHDLDLSSIVPANAKFVWMVGYIRDEVLGSYFQLRKNGNSNALNAGTVRVEVGGVAAFYWDFNWSIACDASRIIEYRASNVTFTNINLIVASWVV